MRTEKTKPTDAELEILKVLWERGDSTVREVHEALLPVKDLGYTTILKQMQIMLDKGLLHRDASQRTHVFRAAVSKEATQAGLLDRLLEGAFGGSALQLVMQALGHRKASAQELRQIRDLLDRLESEDGPEGGAGR
jgi:predicted transcriptional regulator